MNEGPDVDDDVTDITDEGNDEGGGADDDGGGEDEGEGHEDDDVDDDPLTDPQMIPYNRLQSGGHNKYVLADTFRLYTSRDITYSIFIGSTKRSM